MKPHSIRINDSQADVTSKSRTASPIEVIHEIGKRHAESLRGIGIETVDELARITDIEGMSDILGIPVRTLNRIKPGVS